MKRLINRIFGIKSAPAAVQPVAEASVSPEALVDQPVSRELFVAASPSANQPAAAEKQVAAFLAGDHFAAGMQTGYQHHSADHLRRQVNLLAAQYRSLVQDEVALLEQQATEYRLHLVEVGNQFPELREQLEIRLEALRQQQEQHRRELVNSVELEGRISAVVKAYEAGYEQGMKQYLVEKGLLGDYEK